MAEFVKVAKKSEIPDDRGFAVEVKGKPIGLFKAGGKVYAADRVCPHRGGPLEEGGLDGTKVMCPWHGWEFDVSSGSCLSGSDGRLGVYAVKEEGDDIFVAV